MSTINLTSGGSTGFPWSTDGTARIVKTLDCKAHPLGAGDVAQIINVPAGAHVRLAWHITKADSGASTRTFSLGDGSAAGGFVTNHDAKTPGSFSHNLTLTEGTPNTVAGYSNGKFYAAADTVDLTAVQALTDCVVTVVAFLTNLGK